MMNDLQATRKGNFLYYGTGDHICSCLLFLFAIVLSMFFPLEDKKPSPTVLYILAGGTTLFGCAVLYYSAAAIDNLLFLPLFLPLKLLVAGLLIFLTLIAVGSFFAALEKGQSGEQRLASAGKGAAAGGAVTGIYYLMQKWTRHQ